MKDRTMSSSAAASEPRIENEEEPAAASVSVHPRAERNQHLRIVEALLFAASEPVDAAHLAQQLPPGADVEALLADLQQNFANRGVNVVQVAGKWALRTAGDL